MLKDSSLKVLKMYDILIYNGIVIWGGIVKIIHCSDLHLDSAMETNLSAEKAKERSREMRRTFERMVAFAKENAVRAIIIAGDMFDTERVTMRTSDFVLGIISSAPEIDFLYLKGNHDENNSVFKNKQLPQNLKFFSDSWLSYRYENVVISGIELTEENKNSLYDSLSLSSADVNIVTMHGQTSTQTGSEEICLNKLKGKSIRYLALGHIHSYRKEQLDLDGEWCYCGCLEGRGFDECSDKGFVLLEVENNHLDSDFVPFAQRTLFEVPVDISGLVSVNDIIIAAKEASKNIDSKNLIKYVLCGSYTLQTQKDIMYITEALQDDFYFVKVKDESRLKLDEADYSMDISLKGEFVRAVMASSLSEEEKSQIILCGLQALTGEEITL